MLAHLYGGLLELFNDDTEAIEKIMVFFYKKHILSERSENDSVFIFFKDGSLCHVKDKSSDNVLLVCIPKHEARDYLVKEKLDS